MGSNTIPENREIFSDECVKTARKNDEITHCKNNPHTKKTILKLSDLEARELIGKSGASVKIINTSLENINKNVVDEVLNFVSGLVHWAGKDKAKDVVVTGGTEEGHLPGIYSHENGYKIDLRRNAVVDNYIENNFNAIGIRNDGAVLYINSIGAIYAKEGNHWDVIVK
jgi:hypothetical protein